MSKTSSHTTALSKILNEACTKSFVALPNLVKTLNYISMETIGSRVDFHEAKHGYTIFSIKEATFMISYPPRTKTVKVVCRHREAYEWRSEFILTTKNIKALVQFIVDMVNNPPHPVLNG